MPRMEIALVPELSIVTPGVKRATSWKSLMPSWSIDSCVSAVTLIGTLLSASSWRVAVTTTSCRPTVWVLPEAVAASDVWALAWPVSAAALSPASSTQDLPRLTQL